MSFPKYCISVMFVDMSVNKLTNALPILYLPFKRTKRYYKHFPDSTGHKYLYIRFASLPKEIQNVLELTWKHLNYNIFAFFNPLTDELLGDYSLTYLKECFERFNDKNQLDKWLKTIEQTKKWDRNHPVFGKYMIVCSFLFHFAVSACSIKKQFRLFSGKGSVKKGQKLY